MLAKSAAYLLSIILFFSIFVSVGLAVEETNTVFFHGVGITVELEFPKEARPTDSITHNLTITANTNLLLKNLTIAVWAPENQTIAKIGNQTLPSLLLDENDKFPYRLNLILPPYANGALLCLLYAETDQSQDFANFTFYTTQVRSVGYDELIVQYKDLLANFTGLIAKYEILTDEYNALLSENRILITGQEALFRENYALKANYTKLQDSHITLQSEYDKLGANYTHLLSDFNDLTANYDSLQENCTTLANEVNDLKSELLADRVIMLIFIIAVVGLIAMIVYVRRKKQEPYLVIRKETVAINEEKEEEGAS